MIADINDLPPHYPATFRKTTRLGLDAHRINIQQRDARAVGRQRLGVGQSDAARAPRDDDTVAFHFEQFADFHCLTSTRILRPSWRRSRSMPRSTTESNGIVSTHPSSG